MDAHKKKMIAPVVITVLVIVYLCVYFGILVSLIENPVFKVLLGVIPVALGIMMLAVCIQRIREIKGGEEDDLGKY